MDTEGIYPISLRLQESVSAITSSNPTSAVMDTIRMQVFFDTSFPAQSRCML
jgi:hypothetical protein